MCGMHKLTVSKKSYTLTYGQYYIAKLYLAKITLVVLVYW